ncbi:MAG: pilin [Patescibacteria group bacterium]
MWFLNKKLLFLSSVLLILFLVFPVLVQANSESQSDVKIIKPEINIQFGGGLVEFEDVACSGGYCTVPWISQYIAALYRYGIGAAGILAVVMIMVGGFIWLMSAGSPDKVGKAKEFITAALTGLVLALFSFLILNTVNPRLTSLEPLAVKDISYISGNSLNTPAKKSVIPDNTDANTRVSELYQDCETNQDLARFDCYSMFEGARKYYDLGGGEWRFEVPIPTSAQEQQSRLDKGESIFGLLIANGATAQELNSGQFFDFDGLRFNMDKTDPNNPFWIVRPARSFLDSFGF